MWSWSPLPSPLPAAYKRLLAADYQLRANSHQLQAAATTAGPSAYLATLAS